MKCVVTHSKKLSTIQIEPTEHSFLILMIEPLTHITNYSFQEEYFPSKLKIGLITSIFIRGNPTLMEKLTCSKSPSIIRNFRDCYVGLQHFLNKKQSGRKIIAHGTVLRSQSSVL